MRSILNAVQKQNIPIKPVIVISNKPSAKGLKIARKLGVQTEIIESKRFQGTRWEYDQKIIHVLSKYDITPKNSLICLAGFMRILSPKFIKKFKKNFFFKIFFAMGRPISPNPTNPTLIFLILTYPFHNPDNLIGRIFNWTSFNFFDFGIF